MMRWFLLVVCMLSLCVWGADAPAKPGKEKNKKGTALEISADRLEWVMGKDAMSKLSKDKPVPKPESAPKPERAKEDVARLDGNVVVQDETMILTCDHMLVFFEPKKEEGKARKADKKDDDMAVRSIEAEGKVRLTLKEKRQTATGDHAMYDAQAGTVTLDGNCTILGDDGQVMRSNQVVYSKSAGTLTATRVSLTLPVRSKGNGDDGVSGLFGGFPGGRKKEPEAEAPKAEPSGK